MATTPLAAFAPPFAPDTYSPAARERLAPFFSNLNASVYAPLIFSPEIVGALCSRTSRAADDLRTIFLHEYLEPFLEDHTSAYGRQLRDFIAFLQTHPISDIFSNPRARAFYAKWLAQYGDDSIAQMAGMHLVYASLSQITIKHIEDQRIGLAPLEKSTRYVDYGQPVQGHFRYYTDPLLKDLGLEAEYRAAMDGLFRAYRDLQKPLTAWLSSRFPDEKPGVVEKKAFDTLRGLLPTATLSQVALFGNGQAFEYMIARCLRHPLGEIRWAGERAYEELSTIAPAFLRRLKDPAGQDAAAAYQNYLGGKGQRLAPLAQELLPAPFRSLHQPAPGPAVTLVEYDPDGEAKVIAAILYNAPNNHASWNDTLTHVRALPVADKRRILDTYVAGRDQRWQKVGRALESAYVRFDILMNIGAWRDLHRHRLLTQQRQHFTCAHGYDVPPEVSAAGLEPAFRAAIAPVEQLHHTLAAHDRHLAQYAVTLAHRVRFMQWENLRECFWEIELRTIPEGHPDYRHVEQAKFRLLEQVYPLIAQHLRVNLGEYDFARRGQDEKIQQKLRELAGVQPPNQ